MSQANPITNNDNLQVALDLARRRIPVFPFRLVPNPKPGKDPRKTPCIEDWQNRASTNEAQIRRWFGKWPDAMPGIPMGPRTGLLTLDIDQKNGKDGFAGLRAIGFNPEILSDIMSATPSGGRHAVFRWEEGMGNSAAGLPAGVDVRGEGGYIAAPGATHAGGTYRLLSGSLTVDPPALPEALKPRLKAKEPGQGEPTGLPFHVIREALMALPNESDEYGREAWVKVGMALHCEADGDEGGREAWHEWSAQWPGYDPGATDAAWDSFKSEGGVTGWTIITDAEHHGWHNATVTELRLMQDRERQLSVFDDMLESEQDDWREGLDAEALALLGLGPDPNSDDLVMLSPDQCALADPPPYVVKGMIARGNVVSVVGAPGVGKSVLAPFLAYAVAQGRPVFGMRTKPGKVFYIPAENESDMQLRIRALRQELGPADDFRLVMGGSAALKNAAFMRKLKTAIKHERPSMIVVDTLAAAMPGFDENSSEGMGEAIALVRSLTQWGAAVLIVHHDTKAGDGKPRGHSSLHGIVDMNLALERSTDGDVTGSPSKNRNGPSHRPMLAYSIRRVAMGADADGDDLSTVICEESEASATRPRKSLTAKQKAALGILTELLDGRPSIAVSDWRAGCIASAAVSGAEEENDRRKAFRRIMESLAQEGHVAILDDMASLHGDRLAERFTDDMAEEGA